MVLAVAGIESLDTPITSHKERFLEELRLKLDGPIGQDIFERCWRAILDGCEVIGFGFDSIGVYRLNLAHNYQAALPDGSGKTWYLERDLHFLLKPDQFKMEFPYVPKKMRPEDKNAKSVWAWEEHFGSIYTGVASSIHYDAKKQKLVSYSKTDAPWFLSSLINPRVKTPDQIIEEWQRRSRIPC